MKLAVSVVTVMSLYVLLVPANPTAPPKVKRGGPVTFPKSKVDPAPYKAKTLPHKAAVWFKETADGKGWWIDWDAERSEFKRIIIHHSDTRPPDATPQQIESFTAQLYLKRYQLDEKAAGGNDPYVRWLPEHSNHVVNGKQRQIAYHHLIYPDGRLTTELQPLVKINGKWFVDMVGWHAGNWGINCESIAICLIGSFQDRDPSDKAIRALVGLITYYREFNPKVVVEPHSDHKQTDCPGNTWEYWSDKLGLGPAKGAVIKPRHDTIAMGLGETRDYLIEVENTGRLPWKPETHYLNLGFAKAEVDFGLPQHQAVDKIIRAGEIWKVTLRLKAPKRKGTYQITAQMEREKDGRGFGDYIDIKVVVR